MDCEESFMKFKSIQLKNYRQYRDAEIEFSIDPEKNVTVIQGVTGSGKTNLLNAITWCLYGEEKHLTRRDSGLPIVNTFTIKELSDNEECEVRVELSLIDEQRKIKAIIIRTQRFRKTKDGIKPVSSISGSSLSVLLYEKGRWSLIKNPEYFIEMILPRSLENYFLFDGEKLDEYFLESGRRIEAEVQRMSQIDVIENALRHLSSIEKIIRNKIREESGNLEINKIAVEIERLETYIEQLKEKLNEFLKEREKFESELRRIEDLAIKYERIKSMIDRERQLKLQVDSLREELEEVENEKVSYLLEMSPRLLVYKAINDCIKKIGERKEAGEIPPEYKKSFIKKLLDRGRCICGAELPPGSKYRQNIERILRETDELTDYSEELIRLHGILNRIKDDISNFERKIGQFNGRIKILNEKIRSYEEQIELLRKQTEGYSDEDIQYYIGKRREYRYHIQRLSEEIGRYRLEIQSKEQELKKNRNLYERLIKKEEKLEKYSKQLEILRKSIDKLSQIKNEIIEETKREIEQRVNESFLSLIWKKEDYKEVKIKEGYQLSVKHASGLEGLGTLSAGESQVLALSFIIGLNVVSGFNAPIIIDTPLGRLAKDVRINLMKNLAKYLENRQIILLVTDAEYTVDVRRAISENVGKEYYIHFEETGIGGIAKVMPL